MRSTSKPRILGAATALGILMAIQAAPATAECTRQINRWPAFDSVAPTARRVVVGTVLRTNRLEPIDNGAFAGALELYDRETGAGLTVTLWETKEARDESERLAATIRTEGESEEGFEILGVERYEVTTHAL